MKQKALARHSWAFLILALMGWGGTQILNAAAVPQWIGLADGKGGITLTRNGQDFLRIGLAVWGPNWGWTGISGKVDAENRAASGTLASKIGDASLSLDFSARQSAPNTLQITYALRASKDTDLTLYVVELDPAKSFGVDAVSAESQGKITRLKFPFGKGSIGEEVSALRFRDTSGEVTTVRFEPPARVATDGAVRIILAQDKLAAGPAKPLTVTVALPQPATWYASAEEIPDADNMAAWYPWRGTGAGADSLLDMTDWLEKPAGKHGRITRRNEQLLYNGQPIKLWGLNLCYSACAPEKSMADKRAAFYPRYGINTVRLHKFADGSGWNGIQAKESAAEYDPAGLERMDYQVAKFKEAGIYVKLSAHFGSMKMGPADRRDVPYMDEFGGMERGANRVSAPHSAFFYSPELQNLQIRQMVNLLKHTNGHTGLTYAKDPAISPSKSSTSKAFSFTPRWAR